MTYTVTLTGDHGVTGADMDETIEFYRETLERVLGGAAVVEATYLAACEGLPAGRAWSYAEPLARFSALAGWDNVPPSVYFSIEVVPSCR